MPGRLDLITPAENLRDGGNVRLPVMIRFQPSLSPAAVAISGLSTTVEQALTVAGILINDVILTVSKPTSQAGLGVVGWRTYSTSQIAINFSVGSASITPTATEIYQIVVLRGR